jgi:imidazolonepropionase
MTTVIYNPAQIITVNSNGINYKKKDTINDIGVMENHSIVIEEGLIKDFVPSNSISRISADNIIDISGKVIMPGFVECHTHTVFAGSRANEFREKLKGKSYEDIVHAGGGINKTVNAVRDLSIDELVQLAIPKISYFIRQGVTTIEIKSGYGLDFENELKILRAIKKLKQIFPIDILPTFLGAHTYPTEYKNNHKEYLDLIIEKMLPEIVKENLTVFCDAFVEKTAFSAEEIEAVFQAAKSYDLKLSLHTEQFNNIGGIDLLKKFNIANVDHLEVLKEEDIKLMADTGTTAVLLPGVSLFQKYSYAPARKLIDNNVITALASDYNPGSCSISNISVIMGLAAINMQMTIEEVISAYTLNSANALLLSTDRGSIELGKKADFSVLNTNDYSDLIYNFGKNLNYMTIKNGNIIYKEKEF